MTDFDRNFETLFNAWTTEQEAPSTLAGAFGDDDTYRAQLRMLERRLAQGERHAGWKIGQTNRQMRRERGESQPAPGFLLRSDQHATGLEIDLSGTDDWYMEPELAFALDADLIGPGIDPVVVRRALAGVMPAIELVRPRKDWPDRALLRAVNGATAGFVLGEQLSIQPTARELDAMRVEVAVNGETTHDVIAGEVNDNPLESIAWLANYLTGLGQPLRQGQIILAGSYAGLVPMSAGQHWRAKLGGYGAVECRTR